MDDWRLRGWVTDAGAPAWAAPVSAYSIVPFAGQGDLVLKTNGSALIYDQNGIAFDYPTDYDGVGGTGGYWDLGFQDLGSAVPVTLPDGVTTGVPYISSIQMATGKDLIVFYSNRFRNGYHSGLWAMRVIDDSAGHLWWSEPSEIFKSVAIDDFNYQSQFFISFPILKSINNEYWVFALECSKEVNVITYHLCYSRSTDGIHWTDREYLAGASGDASEATIGINKYDSATAFVLADLKNAYISVSGNKVYMSCPSGVKLSTAATSLVGVTNSAMQLDITPDIPQWSLNMPTAPSAAQGNYTLENQYKKYNGSAILIPGARVTHKAGYVTSNGNELITVGYELVDEVRQASDITKNELTVTTSDYTAWLRDYSTDMFLEYWSPQQATYDNFCDLTALNVINGRFFIGFDGTNTDLFASTLDPNDYTDEDMGYVNPHRAADGSIEFKFQFIGSHNIYLTAAAVFQGLNDRQFYAAAYWEVLGKWVISVAQPKTAGKKFYAFYPIYTGAADTPTVNTWYWGKVIQWHNHILFMTSTDRITWSVKIDYTAPAASITANDNYWGLLGHSHSISSAEIGNTDASGGKVAMDSGGSPVYWAIPVTTGSSAGTVTALAGLFTQSGGPADLTVGLALDNGGSPADLTNANNILYQVSSKAMVFSNSDAPVWRGMPVPPYVRVAASTQYWIFWTFQAGLGGGQTWEWYTGGSTTTKTSADGINWSTVSGKSGAAIMYVDYDDGLVKFGGMYYTSAESPKTIEYIAKDIATKASIMSTSVDSFVTGTDLVSGWQPANFGVIGDFVMEADVNATAGPATVYFRATTNQTPNTGYQVTVNSTITIYKNGVLIHSAPSMQFIPTTYHLTISNQTRFIYVYVNECLAATCYDGDLKTPGYFGVATGISDASYTNLRIPDLTAIKPYFVVEQAKTGLAALQDLVQMTRYKFFMRYDGSLRISSFPRRTSVDTYNSTLFSGNLQKSLRYSVNQLMPSGNYYAMRWSAQALDDIGRRRFKKENYTDAQSNEDAYLAASNVLARGREMTEQYQMDSNAIFPAEREDRITVTNPLDGISKDYVITSLDWSYNFEAATSGQKAGLRVFVQ